MCKTKIYKKNWFFLWDMNFFRINTINEKLFKNYKFDV